MVRALVKSSLREIRHSLGRYLAIMAIVGLGVGFFAGLRMAQPSMMVTGVDYLRELNLYDYRLLSTLGFTDGDVESFAGLDGVAAARGSVSTEFLWRAGEGEDRVLMAHALVEDINEPSLVSGRLPQAPDECLGDVNHFAEEDIGRVLQVSPENSEDTRELLAYDGYTLVGLIHSPAYLNFERGTSSIGSGSVSAFVYIPLEGFDFEAYHEIYLTLEQYEKPWSDEYEELIDSRTAEMEDQVRQRADLRYDTLLADAREEIADGQTELDDGWSEYRQERADAEQELQDAYDELTDGEAEYADGLRDYEQGKADYADGLKKYEDGLKEYADGQAELDDARKELDDGWAEYEKAKADTERELADAKKKLDDGQREYDAGMAEYLDGRAELQSGRSQLEAGRRELADAKTQLDDSKEELADAKAALDATKVQLDEAKATLDANKAALDATKAQLETLPEGTPGLNELWAQYNQGLAQYEEGLAQYETGLAQYEEGLAQYNAGQAQYEEGLEQYNAGVAELDASQRELESGEQELSAAARQLADAKRELDDGWAEYADGKAEAEAELEKAHQELLDGEQEYADGQAELQDAWQELIDAEAELADAKRDLDKAPGELADARKELDDGWAEYYDGRAEADAEFADAEQELADGEAELADAREKLAELKKPSTYVLTREENTGYVCFENDTAIVAAISLVFPVFFFLVAALVCMTTMKRMVDEQRTQIGVLKALGYSGGQITGKYLFYSGSAAITGCVAGYALGAHFLPWVIWQIYTIMYGFSPLKFTFSPSLAAVSFAAALLCSMGATWLSCRSELKRPSAELIRPKAPKAGKRVFLEYVTPLWKRLSFLRKVSVRNVLRYRSRLVMMVLGIGGCTALLITGFGLRDSIQHVVDDQFDEITLYDYAVSFQDPMTQADADAYLADRGWEQSDGLLVHSGSVDVVASGGSKSVYLVVSSTGSLENFISLHSGETAIAYPGPGEAVLNTGLAQRLNISRGDVIRLRDEKRGTLEVTVSAICDNYVFNYVYVARQTYLDQGLEPPEYEAMYLHARQGTDLYEDGAALSDYEGVSNVTVNEATRERVDTMLARMDLIVVVVVLCAAALAFIVLYNLTNINITERVREIATIKVLGFYQNETAAYVFREISMLSVLGSLAGLGLGKLLHAYVMAQVQVDGMFFPHQIAPISYIGSLIMTWLFTLIITFAMRPKLRRIDMAESLKSIE